MHLNDAIGRCPGLSYVACHHEQACAMAADSYYRLTNQLAAVNVTTGPGGINALNGVFGAWTDSLGMIVVSGQVKWETTIRSTDLPLRQLGDQEVDIVSMAKPVTKYAVMIEDVADVRYHLEKALFLSTHGRPGPVWLDVPMNVQGSLIEPENLRSFDPAEVEEVGLRGEELARLAEQTIAKLREAKRPVIMMGAGARLAGVGQQLLDLAERWGMPIVAGWNAYDLIPNDHPSFAGRPGSLGDRGGNFTVQNADVLLILGSRLNIRQISYNWENFAPKAYQIMVDVDDAELKKATVRPDLPICADLKDFVPLLTEQDVSSPGDWLDWCRATWAKYPVVLPEYWENTETVNPYCFMDRLFQYLEEDEVVVTGDGTACVMSFQAAYLKRGQRLYHNSGCASMGYDLPAAIGAGIALRERGQGSKRVICLAGDGSIMMNLQELQTIQTHGLPVKIFVLNNKGYHSIRQTQQNFFSDNIVGCGTESGLGFPSFEKLAAVFDLEYSACRNHAELDAGITAALNAPGASICEVFLDLNQQFAPKLSSRKLDDGRMVTSPLQDMAPFLSREELAANMLQ